MAELPKFRKYENAKQGVEPDDKKELKKIVKVEFYNENRKTIVGADSGKGIKKAESEVNKGIRDCLRACIE